MTPVHDQTQARSTTDSDAKFIHSSRWTTTQTKRRHAAESTNVSEQTTRQQTQLYFTDARRQSVSTKLLNGTEITPNRPKWDPNHIKLKKMDPKWHAKCGRGVPLRSWKTRLRKKTPTPGKRDATFDNKLGFGMILVTILAPRGSRRGHKILIFDKKSS